MITVTTNLPYSFAEHVRLEAQAVHLSACMNDKVIHALIDRRSGIRMLDIGCGTGIVTDLMAETYPQAECIGLDISKVPNLRPHEKNVRFFEGNATSQKPSQWKANDGKAGLSDDKAGFDYIFSRLLILGMHDWPDYIKTEFDLLRPGGWVEVHDLGLGLVRPEQHSHQQGLGVAADSDLDARNREEL